MRPAFALLAACVLLSTLPAAVADNPAAGQEIAVAAQALTPEELLGEPLATPESNCEPALDLPAMLGGPEPTPAAINCGACSSSNCVGVPRGTRCHLGPIIGGWGWCNIYSGGYMCPSGGWECQCGTGPLP